MNPTHDQKGRKTVAGKNVSLWIAGLLGLTLTGLVSAQEATKPALDPFVVLITKPKPKRRPSKPTTFRPSAPSRPRIPPLIIKISTVISAGDESMAVIDYNGQEYIVNKGWDGSEEQGNFDGRFKVVEVEEDHIVVFDKKAKQRRTIRDGDSGPGGGVELTASGG
jgi:hypothetical protein